MQHAAKAEATAAAARAAKARSEAARDQARIAEAQRLRRAEVQIQLAAMHAMHAHGNGGPVDYAETRRLLGLAVEQGNADAQSILGFMHACGDGGPVDYAEAGEA